MTYLDATATDPGFAAFGRMTDGKPVAEAILGKPTDPNAGIGAMKGEILVHPVKIISIRRAPPPDPAVAPPAAATPAAPAAAPSAPTPAPPKA
jgi:peptidyl-prolyl cis-trans isomerase A (cyclophilin A)